MESKIVIDPIDLKIVCKSLRKRGYTNKSIANEIGSRIDGCLYYGYALPISSFKKLESLIERKIKIEKIKERIVLEKSNELSELFGIILGDGNITIVNKSAWLAISLNYVDDYEYFVYVKGLMERLFKKEVKIKEKSDTKADELVVYDKSIVFQLLSMGLVFGNKVKKQVGVPIWIIKNISYIIDCLRGLIDTDGSIYHKNADDTICINFTNKSINLLKDFKEMCNKIGVNTGNITGCHLNIGSKKQVKKFLEIVKPIKWKILGKKHPDWVKKLDYKINYPTKNV